MSAAYIQTVKASFYRSVGDIVFGMEGWNRLHLRPRFWRGRQCTDSKTVLLAGATGAAAAAVSMMAGTYLDVETSRAQARTQLARKRARDCAAAAERSRSAGRAAARGEVRRAGARRHLARAAAHAGHLAAGGGGPSAAPPGGSATRWCNPCGCLCRPGGCRHSGHPFAYLDLDPARIVSMLVTGLLLVGLGLGRAKVAQANLVRTVLETIGIAAAAAAPGLLIGKVVTL